VTKKKTPGRSRGRSPQKKLTLAALLAGLLLPALAALLSALTGLLLLLARLLLAAAALLLAGLVLTALLLPRRLAALLLTRLLIAALILLNIFVRISHLKYLIVETQPVRRNYELAHYKHYWQTSLTLNSLCREHWK
jgi:hypothetical protein